MEIFGRILTDADSLTNRSGERTAIPRMDARALDALHTENWCATRGLEPRKGEPHVGSGTEYGGNTIDSRLENFKKHMKLVK